MLLSSLKKMPYDAEKEEERLHSNWFKWAVLSSVSDGIYFCTGCVLRTLGERPVGGEERALCE